MAGVFSIAAPLVSGIGSLFGHSNAQNVQLPPQFIPPNLTPAANDAFAIPGSLSGLTPQAYTAGQNIYNNPYANSYLGGASTASGLGQNAALGAYNAGNFLSGAGASLAPYASSIMNTAFDPQNDLYNKLFQQNTDQTRAGEAARGIAMTPYGAGLENQSNQDFNLAWQNAQLGRQVQGAGAAGGLIDSAGRAIAGGQTLAGGAPASFLTASGYPYSTFNSIGSNQLTGLENSTAIPQQLFSDYLNYLGMGNSANSVANQNAQLGLNQANLAFNQNQTLGANLGSALQGLSNPNAWQFLNQMGLGYGAPAMSSPYLGF